MTNLFIIFLLILILLNTLICSYSLNIANYFNIIDFPSKGKKKIHLKPTPLTGGIIFFTNIFLYKIIYNTLFFKEISELYSRGK